MQLQSNGSAPQPKSLHCNYFSSAFFQLTDVDRQSPMESFLERDQRLYPYQS